MLSLFDTDIQTSPTFTSLPRFDSILFKGFVGEKLQKFAATLGGRNCTVLAATIIRKDDKFIWESCDDLLGRAVKDAAFQVRGVYCFDLLNFDVHTEINTFNFQDLTNLIVNHSRKLQVGQMELIKYCSCYGLLKKIADEEWGKIAFKTRVEVYSKEPKQFDLFVKKSLKVTQSSAPPVILVINDQSLHPILDKNDEEQRQRLIKMFFTELSDLEELPEVYVNDKNGCVELVSEYR